MPMRGIEMLAIAAGGGAAAGAAAAAFCWGACVAWVVGSAVGEADGEAVAEAAATMFLDTAVARSGEGPTAGILASRSTKPIAETIRPPRLGFTSLPPLRSRLGALTLSHGTALLVKDGSTEGALRHFPPLIGQGL